MIVARVMLKPVYLAFFKEHVRVFLQTTHFVKSRAHSPRPTRKIIAMIALRQPILMRADAVVSLHARCFIGLNRAKKEQILSEVCMIKKEKQRLIVLLTSDVMKKSLLKG